MGNSSNDGDGRLPHDRVPSTVQGTEDAEEAVGPQSPPAPSQNDRRVHILSVAIPPAVALVGALLLGLWLLGDRREVDVQPRAGDMTVIDDTAVVPEEGAEDLEQPDDNEAPDEPAEIEIIAPEPDDRAEAAPATRARQPRGNGGAWPAFRGGRRDGQARGETGLASSWPQDGPRKLWEIEMLGPGHGGAAIDNGRVYVLDYDRDSREDVLRCLSLADGREIWRYSYAVDIRDNHGISRTVPAVADGYVVSLGPMGHVTCARADSGEVLWRVDLRQAYGTSIPRWYAGQCPLIEDGKAIIAPGGRALMIAIDLATGSVEWETPNPDGWDMTHASIMPARIGNSRQYVYPASGGVVGVSSVDGSVAWKYSRWTVDTANIPTPVPTGDDRIFLTGGYGAGSMLLSTRGGNPTQVWKVPQRVFGSHQHTPILHQNHLYGVAIDRQLVCLNLEGERVWSSGHTARFGLGPYLLADGKLYVLSDDGTLVMAEATTSGYNELARAKVLPGPDAWAPMALADGTLVLRDRDNMIALDVRKP